MFSNTLASRADEMPTFEIKNVGRELKPQKKTTTTPGVSLFFVCSEISSDQLVPEVVKKNLEC